MPTDTDPVRSVTWAHGRAEVQRLGAMLAPVVFRAAGHADFSPLQVAPWADEPGGEALPGVLRRLRGDWPCVPFGAADRPAGLPAGWRAREPGDAWGHGYASNHDWSWCERPDEHTLVLAIEPPGPGPVRRMTRRVRAVPDAPALDVTVAIEVDRACTLPVALHPTLRLNVGRVALHLPHGGPCFSYPVPAEPGVSRLQPDTRFADLRAAPRTGGGNVDLTRYPLGFDTEELLQVRAVSGPVRVDYLDLGWSLQLEWDRSLLPDAMLWVSHRGRRQVPWNGRHLALGIEPLNSVFDLARVAAPPAEHGLADRVGLTLSPGSPCVLSYRFEAHPS